jgi:hypothetical protein
VTFSGLTRIHSRDGLTDGSVDFAAATIVYPEGGSHGRLIYLKPCFLSDIPADVRSYGAAHNAFPHESTMEQWFTESQFESYRHLGDHEMSRLITLMHRTEQNLRALFDTAAANGN